MAINFTAPRFEIFLFLSVAFLAFGGTSSGNQVVPAATMVKQQDGAWYIFAVGMSDGQTTVKFKFRNFVVGQSVEALEENRTLAAKNGAFTDTFEPRAVHLYPIPGTPGVPRG